MKRSIGVTIIIILIIAVVAVGYVLQFFRFNHDPIEINENQDFVVQGWPGSGTESDPYVISGFIVGQSYVIWEDGTEYVRLAEAAVVIRNTTAFFIITNCVFTGGVKLINVKNGVIRNCEAGDPTTTHRMDYAFHGINISYCSIERNSFGNNNAYSISLENGENNTISGNILFDTASDSSRCRVGIYLSGQTLLNCRLNTISNYDTGIELRNCSGGEISHWVSENHIEKSGYGLFLRGCTNLPVYENELYNNTIGIDLSGSIAVRFVNNTISDSSDGGVWFRTSCIDCILSNNVINNNGWAGITFDWMSETTHPAQATINDIRHNDGWGIIVNGRNNVILYGNILADNTLGNVGYNISYNPNQISSVQCSQIRDILVPCQISLECILLSEKRS
ncbi:MAG: right-handed parallel beta-helix repeat-containing protein [Candidatus Thorarchaeota archaeon]